MLFWIICGILALLVAGSLILPLLRGGAERELPQTEVEIYKAQLAEVDRDLARGVLDAEEAERARTEIARRLLAADKAAPTQVGDAPRGLTTGVAAVTAVLILGGGGWLYSEIGAVDASGPYPDIPLQARIEASAEARETRPSQEEAMATWATLSPPPPTADLPQDYLDMVAQLREVMPTRPDELRGWQLLAQHEAALGNFAAALTAQERVVALTAPPGDVLERERLADLMVASAGGFVSPEAEAILLGLLEENPRSFAARYYLGLLYLETDRPDIAFRLWRGVIEDGHAGIPHVRLARGLIEQAAFRAGVEYQLPPERGPTAEDMAAAEEMDPEAREQMIRGMVEGLEARLATDGGPASDWARLIGALAVLGDEGRARSILTEARTRFAGRADDLALIEDAAGRTGLTGP